MGVLVYTGARKEFFWRIWLLAAGVTLITGIGSRILTTHMETAAQDKKLSASGNIENLSNGNTDRSETEYISTVLESNFRQ